MEEPWAAVGRNQAIEPRRGEERGVLDSPVGGHSTLTVEKSPPFLLSYLASSVPSYDYPPLSCFLGKIIRAIYPELAQNLPLTNRRSREKFIHHEDSRREKRLWRCATWAVVQSTLACILPDVLHAMTRRRKHNRDVSSIWSCLDCEEIIVAELFLPSFFFVLFVAFVVKHLVAAEGCPRDSVVNISSVEHVRTQEIAHVQSGSTASTGAHNSRYHRRRIGGELTARRREHGETFFEFRVEHDGVLSGGVWRQ